MTIAAVAAFVMLSAFSTKEETATYSADIQKSSIEWLGKKVTGQHNGHIQFKSADLNLKNGKLTGGNFVVDMTSITNEDLKDESYNQKLVGHLKSEDFFGVEKHPTAKFVITDVDQTNEIEYEVKGNITIKDITKPIAFPATITVTGNTVTANAKVVIDRSEFNVRYGSSSFFDNLGDKMIYDDFELNIAIVASK